jgi:hypothetical protein
MSAGSIFGRDAETPAEKARAQVRIRIANMVDSLAVDGYEATRHEDPVEGFRVITRTRLDPALAGLRAAAAIRAAAYAQIYEHAMNARGDGATWAQIGRALGIDGEEWEGQDPAETIYRYLVWDEPLPDVSPSWGRREGKARWTCRSCGQRVSDDGPWEANPENIESGHAEDCERHRAEIAAVRAAWGDE